MEHKIWSLSSRVQWSTTSSLGQLTTTGERLVLWPGCFKASPCIIFLLNSTQKIGDKRARGKPCNNVIHQQFGSLDSALGLSAILIWTFRFLYIKGSRLNIKLKKESGKLAHWNASCLFQPSTQKGDPEITENFRPVSCLPVSSKLLEKIIYEQMAVFIESNHLLPDNQHGFWANRSTMSAWADI